MKLVKEHINEKFREEGDPIEDLGIGLRNFWKKERNKLSKMHSYDVYRTYFRLYRPEKQLLLAGVLKDMIFKLANGEDAQTAFKKVCEYWRINNSDGYTYRAKVYLSGIRKKIAKVLKEHFYVDVNPIFESINEKFEEDSDPIHDMNIGPQDRVYKCGSCGNLININGEDLEGEEFENAKAIINAFGDKRIVKISCYNCYQEELDNQEQENYA